MTFGMDPAATAAADEALTIALAAYARAAGAPTPTDALTAAQAARATFPNLGADVTSGARALTVIEEHVAAAVAFRAAALRGLRGEPDNAVLARVAHRVEPDGTRVPPARVEECACGWLRWWDDVDSDVTSGSSGPHDRRNHHHVWVHRWPAMSGVGGDRG